jgi:hypothetical protein
MDSSLHEAALGCNCDPEFSHCLRDVFFGRLCCNGFRASRTLHNWLFSRDGETLSESMKEPSNTLGSRLICARKHGAQQAKLVIRAKRGLVFLHDDWMQGGARRHPRGLLEITCDIKDSRGSSLGVKIYRKDRKETPQSRKKKRAGTQGLPDFFLRP